MFSNLLISVISDDKPGVVESVANAVSKNNGNWLESSLSQLAGKFAGVIRVAIDDSHIDELERHLHSLAQQGIWIKTDHIQSAPSQAEPCRRADIHVLGPDRPGIVHELAKAFAQSQVNLAKLETSLASMPYSGEPLFEATAQLEIPISVDMNSLHDTLNNIADMLALDISLNDHPFDD